MQNQNPSNIYIYWLLPQKAVWPPGTSVSKDCSCKENLKTQMPSYLAECVWEPERMALPWVISSLITTLAVIATAGETWVIYPVSLRERSKGIPNLHTLHKGIFHWRGPSQKQMPDTTAYFAPPKGQRLSGALVLYELCPLKDSHGAPTLIRAIITLMGVLWKKSGKIREAGNSGNTPI